MSEIVVGAIALALVSLLAFAQERERRAWYAERAALLDRVMTRSYAELKAYEPRPTPEPATLTEAERRAIAEAERLADEAHGIV